LACSRLTKCKEEYEKYGANRLAEGKLPLRAAPWPDRRNSRLPPRTKRIRPSPFEACAARKRLRVTAIAE
jgi:hypothetical protein